VIHLKTWMQPTDADARGRIRMCDDDDLVIVSAFKKLCRWFADLVSALQQIQR